MQRNQSVIRDKSYDFSLRIIRLCEKFPNKRVFWIIADQLIRAATSIGANIIEAKSSSSKKDFIKFYQIALKSANETEYWLNLLFDASTDRSLQSEIKIILEELNSIGNILGKSLITMKGKS